MPKYIVEVEYLLPVYKRVTVEAESVQGACRRALETDWDKNEHDYEASSPEYINGIWDTSNQRGDFVQTDYDVPDVYQPCFNERPWQPPSASRPAWSFEERRAERSSS